MTVSRLVFTDSHLHDAHSLTGGDDVHQQEKQFIRKMLSRSLTTAMRGERKRDASHVLENSKFEKNNPVLYILDLTSLLIPSSRDRKVLLLVL
jgi:hypothetical protein